MKAVAAFLNSLKSTAEHLTDTERLALILRRAFAKFFRKRTGPPTLRRVEKLAM